ncbi:MAG: two-component regulator propeller domain-containing protein [bacterium]
MQRKLLIFSGFILVLCVFMTTGLSQVLEWKSFTNIGTIRDIVIGNGSVWSGSNGGAIEFQLENETINTFSNTEGLASNQVVAVEIDQHGTVWFALFDGRLNRYFPDTGEWDVIVDYLDQIITDLVSFGDSLYVGLDIGVSLYTIDKQEVKETYVNFGLSGGALEKIGANSVFIDGLDIWVATDKGIAQSSLSFSNLQAPANWNQYDTGDGLPSNTVNKVIVLESVPFAATTAGVSRLNGGVWENVGNLNANAAALEIVAANEFFPQRTLVTFTSSGVFWLNPAGQWLRLGSSLFDVSALNSDDAGNVWIGRKEKGLAQFDFAGGVWILHETNSPGSNNFKSLTLDSKGRLWAASEQSAGQSGGIQMFDREQWRHFTKADGLKSEDQRTVIEDSAGRIVFGSWGGGMTVFEESGNGFEIMQIDTTGGLLAGSVTPGFVLVNDLALDPSGNIWALNRQANNTRVLVAFTPDGQVVHFSTNEGLLTPFVLAVEVDRAGRIWIGTEDRGIKVLDYKGTLFDKNDDDFTQGLNRNEGLNSNKITALVEDKEGIIWIGSEDGVNFWLGGQPQRQGGLINEFVNTIGVDGQNNKWFGTAGGVTVLSSDGVTLTQYTTGNSPLVSGDVQSFAFNEDTGEVWIGTTNGLSRLQTPFTAPKEDLSLLTGYPNPFILEAAGRVFTITNLSQNTSVVIYSSAGVRIRSYQTSDIQGAQVFWDGRDEDGNLVSSGIFVFLAYTGGNVSATGKVAVIKR